MLHCDGCGQAASAEHISRRLQRLEWSTRFRPVHIGTLLLGAFAPERDAEYLYAPAGPREGEARLVLEAAGIATEGKSVESVLSEFQRAGLFLTHVLECPLEAGAPQAPAKRIGAHLPAAIARIRRSLRPKRLVLISSLLAEHVPALQAANLGCVLVLDEGKPVALEAGATERARLRELLVPLTSARLGAV